MKKKTIVLAYSGGLDTSIILKWLQENYNAEVIAWKSKRKGINFFKILYPLTINLLEELLGGKADHSFYIYIFLVSRAGVVVEVPGPKMPYPYLFS